MSHQRGHFEAPKVLRAKDDACGDGQIRKARNGHQCVLKVGGVEKYRRIPSKVGLESVRVTRGALQKPVPAHQNTEVQTSLFKPLIERTRTCGEGSRSHSMMSEVLE